MMGQRPYGKLLVALDSQLEMQSARQFLVISSLVGLAVGNGLGLAIAKTIVTAPKGKIAAESEPGHWACFTVTL